MGLVNLTTNLKSLRYGKDQLGGGYSGQPYIKASIPEGFNDLQTSNNDFILRGGALTARNSATDVLRLGKMFTDTKSPNGILFVAKQNLLSRTAVRTQASTGLLNEGVYTPLSTLAEAGLVAFGTHVNKQGLNPFAETGAYSNNSNLYGVKIKTTQPAAENRLVEIFNTKQNVANESINIRSYSGGPGSILGVGKTNIRFTDQRTGINNSKNPSGRYYGPLTWTPPVKNKLGNIPNSSNFLFAAAGFSQAISEVLPKQLPGSNFISLQSYSNNIRNNVYISSTSYTSPTQYAANLEAVEDPLLQTQTPQPGVAYNQQYPQNTFVYAQNNINVEGKNFLGSPIIQDFRQRLRSNLEATQQQNSDESGATPKAPDYNSNQMYESRVNIGGKDGKGPGYKGTKNLVSYAAGSGIGPVDKINAQRVYRGEAVSLLSEKPINDLVKFRIAVISNQNPNLKTFIHFRAFIDNFSDSYSANWNPVTYLGRGENFYTYSNYTRAISMGWTVAAQSKEELIPMYKKLNYLASSLTPYYTSKGYMTGNLVQLTVGGYLYETVGIINSITYDIPEESPWEIGLGDKNTGGEDSTVKELPHIIRVTNFSFTPIQDFIPSVQPLGNQDGLSRYISLADGEGPDKTNYEQQFELERLTSTGTNNRRNNSATKSKLTPIPVPKSKIPTSNKGKNNKVPNPPKPKKNR